MLAHEPSGPIPLQIGPYRILEPIGEGGMGAVYLAEQDHPHREVALKVIRADAFSAQLLRRFEHEAEMLGRLQHPGIAQIYQAGTHPTAHGVQPYFAMEYVRGEPLDVYAREHQLGTHARLELAAKICDAIEHAHQKGVIHRDLKPGNILVTSEGQPKILDFGVARITDADVRTTTLHTDIGVLVGTLTYMSPEQASGDPDQLDTRSDVYSLGVVFFELLTGQLPYRIDRRMVPESVRAIREDEPSRLSTHDRTLRGDVETIVAKTLEKDKARRYASASALASDIRHYLADEPISARPPSAGYQLSKFARRNKVLVGGVAAFFLALVAGAIVATSQAVRARTAEKKALEQTALVTAGLERATKAEKDALAQRDRANGAEQLALERLQRAEIEQKKAQESAAFLESLFGGIDPYEAEGADTTLLRRILAGAAERISTELAGQPEVEASIQRTLGDAYKNLALYPEADRHLHKAEALELELFGEDDRRTLEIQGSIAELLLAQGEHARAEALDRETAEHLEGLFGSDDRDTLERKVGLGTSLTRLGRLAEAETLLRDVLERASARLGAQDPATLRAKFSLARTLLAAQAYEEAETFLGEVVSARSSSLGPDHPSTLEARSNFSVALREQGRLEESEETERELLAAFTRTFGAEHPQTLTVKSNIATLLARQGDNAGAETICRELLETRRRVLGPKHPDTLRTLASIVLLLIDERRFAEAEPLLQEALAGQRAVLGEDHEDTLASKFRMAVLLQEQFRFAESAALLAEIADNKRRTRGESDPALGVALYNLAGTWQNAGDDARAEPLLREVLALRDKYRWKDAPFLTSTVNALANSLGARGEDREAEELFERALAQRRRYGEDQVVYSLRDYGEHLLERGKFERAETLFIELCELESRVRPDSWWATSAKCLLGRSLAGQSRFAEAEPLLKDACESMLADPGAKPSFVVRTTSWVAEMYEAWDAAEPDARHAASAAKWRARAAATKQ